MRYRLEDFDFDLPPERIAQYPASPREAAKLLHVDPSGIAHHATIAQLPELLHPGDLLVFNDTRVVPARLLGTRLKTQGRVEMVLLSPLSYPDWPSALQAPPTGQRWRVLGQANKGLKVGLTAVFGENAPDPLYATVVAQHEQGQADVQLESGAVRLAAALANVGQLPLPPYLNRDVEPEDHSRYQTMFAQVEGSVAAPTAGLHFTKALMAQLRERDVTWCTVNLEVGLGTFLPVRVSDLSQHVMHKERCGISETTALQLNQARREKRRIVAVGTTVVRTLETFVGLDGHFNHGSRLADLFIVPGHSFKAIDAMITNFHLPRSTLVMMISAWLGYVRTKSMYQMAIEAQYRFFSFGDAMLIERQDELN